MKKNIILIIAFLGITFGGCEEYLDKEPLDQYSVATVFKTEQDIKFALNGLYRQIRGFNTTTGNPSNSDYIYTTFTNDAWSRAKKQSPDLTFSPTSIAVKWDYSARYSYIRSVNEFLARSPQAKDAFRDQTLYLRYIAEARVIRAMNYARLNFLYGAVPLLTEPTGPDYYPKRTTQLKVFEFVKDEFDAAAADLPDFYSDPADKMRITKGTALALKARHCLNAIGWHSDLQSLYEEAEAATFAIYNNEYSLDPGVQGFKDLFTKASEYGATSEAIFTISYDRDYKNQGYANAVVARGAYSGTKANNSCFIGATNDLVESFQMLANGLDVHDPASGYDPANPWDGRDPRLDETVVRAGEILPINGGDGINDVYIFDPHPKKNPTDTLPNGKVVYSIKTDDVNKNVNKTGYNYQKYAMDFDYDDPTKSGNIHYHFIRYAEVILMYAEAVLGADNNIPLAMSLVDEIRTRVEMPDVATTYGAVSTSSQALDIILKERRFEFACEGPMRYFDVRRHHLGEVMFADNEVYGIPLGPDRIANANVLEGDLDDSKKIIVGKRLFNADSYYKWPIPQEATDANPNLLEDPEY